jgi:hypothetical protein
MQDATFKISYSWDDFDNSWKLTDFQKHQIKNRYNNEVEATIQKIINESIKDKSGRRAELNAHNDPDNPFELELGGEG